MVPPFSRYVVILAVGISRLLRRQDLGHVEQVRIRGAGLARRRAACARRALPRGMARRPAR